MVDYFVSGGSIDDKVKAEESGDGHVLLVVRPQNSTDEGEEADDHEEWNGRVSAIVAKVNRTTKAEASALRDHLDNQLLRLESHAVAKTKQKTFDGGGSQILSLSGSTGRGRGQAAGMALSDQLSPPSMSQVQPQWEQLGRGRQVSSSPQRPPEIFV